MNQEQPTQAASVAPPDYSANQANGPRGPDRRTGRANSGSKFGFLRLMLWITAYGAAVLFLMAVIITRGLHPAAVLFGSVLLVAIILLVTSYILQWRSRSTS